MRKLLLGLCILAGCTQHTPSAVFDTSRVDTQISTSSTSRGPAPTPAAAPRAGRSSGVSALGAGTVAQLAEPGGDFWWRLSHKCECKSDPKGCPYSGGWFQFKGDTATKVGYFVGATYDEQRGMARDWLARIGGPKNGGTRSGWPQCWWVALPFDDA